MKEGSKVFLHNFDYWYISFRYISAPESMRGHALAGGDFLGSVVSAGRLGDGFFAGARSKTLRLRSI